MKNLLKRIRGGTKSGPLRRERQLRFESVEERRLMSVSRGPKLSNDAVGNLAQTDAQDGSISRVDMLGLFTLVEGDGRVTAVERNDLIAICATNSGFNMSADVRDLAHDVVSRNAANRHYQGRILGNLQAGDSSAKLEKLVDKWFYGDDLPKTDKYSHYEVVSGSLFVNGPSYSDIRQGASGDCYVMSSLAEVALKDPTVIENMFVDNGDGTFAVRFYENHTARYVTVNEELPVYYGGPEYASFNPGSGGNELWVALVEKAYCQMNEEGWTEHNGMNSYQGISSGSPVEMIAEITGQTTDFTAINGRSPSSMLNTIVTAFQNGQAVTLATKNHGTAANVVHDHSYAMIDYNAGTQQVTLFNPWGINNGSEFPGLITIAWSDVVRSFSEWETGAV